MEILDFKPVSRPYWLSDRWYVVGWGRVLVAGDARWLPLAWDEPAGELVPGTE